MPLFGIKPNLFWCVRFFSESKMDIISSTWPAMSAFTAIRSASSKTMTCRLENADTTVPSLEADCLRMSNSLPAVAATTKDFITDGSSFPNIEATWESISTPPYTASGSTFIDLFVASLSTRVHFDKYLLATFEATLNSFDTWMANSRVGTRTNPCTDEFSAGRACAFWQRRIRRQFETIGVAYAIVFPDPVGAIPTTFETDAVFARTFISRE
mmetsp:Transcript_486/g.949  ORF Transcript_486/g.949 Transcript_486/m.949 type:complete len:213 (-) Transcript_486:537-1175(-)